MENLKSERGAMMVEASIYFPIVIAVVIIMVVFTVIKIDAITRLTTNREYSNKFMNAYMADIMMDDTWEDYKGLGMEKTPSADELKSFYAYRKQGEGIYDDSRFFKGLPMNWRFTINGVSRFILRKGSAEYGWSVSSNHQYYCMKNEETFLPLSYFGGNLNLPLGTYNTYSIAGDMEEVLREKKVNDNLYIYEESYHGQRGDLTYEYYLRRSKYYE